MELDERKLQILRAVIDEYILSASPVGSKSIRQSAELNWSPATIRNEMADLEALGYLAQPHTSAGRIPSDKAYRLYVDRMLERAALSEQEQAILNRYYETRIDGIESVLRSTAQALSEITHYTAVVMMPDLAANRLRHLQLVPLAEGKALSVIVTDAGVARDAIIDIPKDMTPDELESLSRTITQRCYNCRMTTVSDRLMREVGAELQSRGDFVKALLTRVEQSAQSGTNMVELSGARNMLRYPEYNDVEKATTFLATVEQRDELYRMLKKASDMEFTITIGSENEQRGLQDCSVVTATYRVNDMPFGTFGIIGPTRMDYNRVVNVLQGVQQNLAAILQSLLKED
ncbi:MAG: heat-inducible transcription repressor HrcA [Clostridia bacterium]|nr:heat-inducible transcription repressor HrcA [Clostridia bacterium]